MYQIDINRTRQVAEQLITAFNHNGIFGNKTMPEDMPPAGVAIGSEDHLRFITLTVAIDYMRNADQLWNAVRLTYQDPQTRYLFDPQAVASTGFAQLLTDLQRYKVTKKHQRDAQIWQTICTTLTLKFKGQVANLITASGTDAPDLIELVRSPRYRQGFPNLKGAKICPLWIRMLYDNCQVPFNRIGEIPLPVDIHTAQATIQTGCVKVIEGQGNWKDLTSAIHNVWREALKDAPSGVYPLRMDEPLWMLSRQGCRITRTWPCEFLSSCPVGNFCQPQYLKLQSGDVQLTEQSEWAIPVLDKQVHS